MPVDASIRTAAAWVLAALVALVPLVFARAAMQPIITPKLVALLVGVAVLVGLGIAAMARARKFAVPASPVIVAAGVLVAVMVATALRGEGIWPVLWGPTDRGSGLLLYVALALLLWLVLLLMGREGLGRALGGMLAASGIIAGYAGLQGLGIDPIGWRTDFPQVGTLGNPNFVSALLGISVPLAAYVALSDRLDQRVRVGAGVLAVAALGVAAWTGSVQGPIAAVGGVGLLLIVWLIDRGTLGARRIAVALSALGVLGVAALVAGLAGAGPAAFLQTRAAIGPRLFYWDAAVEMFRDAPWFGQGFGMYASYYRVFRPEGAAEEFGLDLSNDAAHSVPLEMFAEGGLVLGLAYLAFVATTGVVLVRGIARSSGSTRLLLGGLGGAWLAYQAQAVVSIDVPPLALWHWVLTALITIAATDAVPVWAVPREASPARGRAWKRRVLASRISGAAVAALLILAAWQPLRADLVAGEASARLEGGDVLGAREAAERATSTIPGRSDYWVLAGEIELRAGDEGRAFTHLRRGVVANPRDWPAVASAARVADQLDDADADELWEHARAVEPHALEYREDD